MADLAAHADRYDDDAADTRGDGLLDWLFEAVDDALWAGDAAQEWPDLDAWSRTLDPEALSITMVVGVLSITLPVKRQEWRVRWFGLAKQTIEARCPEEAEDLLVGLES